MGQLMEHRMVGKDLKDHLIPILARVSNPETPEEWDSWSPLAGGACGWQWQSDPSSTATRSPGLTLNFAGAVLGEQKPSS